ncbi:MAG TPA: DUF2062 domain-containing protein [Candidatus Polarisedimenticolia bacterium]|nr:DUF2062 domain-containing protein [Candidatus Polarisedimenticolia bacterium]
MSDTAAGAKQSLAARARDLLFHRHLETGRLSIAVGIGVFIGLTPFYGFHTLLAIALAWALGLNVTAMVLATNISNPLLAPFLIAGSVWIGDSIGSPGTAADASLWDFAHPRFYVSWLRGGLILGAFLGILCGLTTYAAASRIRRRHRAPDV